MDIRNAKKLEITQTRVAGDFTDETLGLNPLSKNQYENNSIESKPFKETDFILKTQRIILITR